MLTHLHLLWRGTQDRLTGPSYPRSRVYKLFPLSPFRLRDSDAWCIIRALKQMDERAVWLTGGPLLSHRDVSVYARVLQIAKRSLKPVTRLELMR